MSQSFRRGVSVPLLCLALTATACGGDDKGGNGGAQAAVQSGEFTARVDNPFVPLASVPVTVFKGTDRDPAEPKPIKTRVENRALPKTQRIAGVDVTAVSVKEYEDGEIKEGTVDYFAQRRDGAVIYFGQHVDNYRNGKIVAHRGQWIAGQGNAKRGLFMPAKPKVGQVFEQERVPGIAIDQSTVLALGVTVKTPAGKFKDWHEGQGLREARQAHGDQVLLRGRRPGPRRRAARALLTRPLSPRRLARRTRPPEA